LGSILREGGLEKVGRLAAEASAGGAALAMSPANLPFDCAQVSVAGDGRVISLCSDM